jgi:hypothetical protein
MVNFFSNHHEFIANQHATVTNLIAEGNGHIKNSVASAEDLIQILNDKKPDLKKAAEGLVKGNGALKDNVEFGDKTT